MGKKQDDRKKGMEYMREVKEILERNGCTVEGPGFAVRFFPKKGKDGEKRKASAVPIHKDYFGCFDLISYRPDMGFVFHQVSIIEEKSRKVDDLIQANMPGWVWGRTYEGSKVAYRVFSVRDTTVIEREGVILLTPPKKVEDFGLLGSQKKFEITLFEKGEEAWNSLSS